MPDSTLPLVDPFHDPSLPSLADALSKFEAMPDVTLSRKARARAAVAMLGRLLHRSPAEIPAQATYLRQRFMQLKHSPSGLTAKSLANCKSELRYLVRMVCGRGSKCQFRPLSAGWACLRDKIKDEPAHWTLSRFMAFCSAVGVMPEAVDDSVIERFRAALLDSGEVIKPEAVVRRTITTWNQLAATEPQWPEATLFMPPRRIKRWTIEPERFLEAFRQDVDRWLERLSKVDPEAEDGPVRPLRPASLRLHRHQIFKAASALVFTGQPIETVTSLACLVDFETFKKILAYLRERQGGHPTTALLGLARTLKAIAKHHGLVGASDVARMGRICANYVRDLETYTPKSRDRLQSFEDERMLGALVHLPERLLAEAGLPRTSPRKAKMLAQFAIAIEVELHTPLRLSNLVALNPRQNIQAITVKGKARWIIRFDRHETKNRSLLIHELPAESVKLIERARRFYQQPNGWLFPGAKGSHKQSSLLGKQIKTEIERRLGTAFNVHLFRGIDSTMQIRENDNGFEIVRALLGDRSDKVIRKHYTSTAERHLIAEAQETLRRVRVRTAPIAPSHSNRQLAARGARP